MEFVINSKQLRKALKEIKRAERNGFMYCQAVFKFVKAGKTLDDNVADYENLIEKAHPADGNLDWGRGQNVTRNYKFINGELKNEKTK